jgi:hypothetical protein
MIAYCSYCSAQKNKSTSPLPAIDLYKSERIAKIYNASIKEKATFVILSGLYGIISPDEQIKFYDHLLLAEEVDTHVALIASQIRSMGIHEMIFFMNSIERDNNLRPYLDCMEKACLKLKIPLKIRITDLRD